MATKEQNQTLGRGEVHFSRFKTGTQTPEGYRYFGNTPEFNLTADSETLDHYGMDAGLKEKDKSVTLQTNRRGTFTCDDIDLENLAVFFMGTASTVAQASATGTTETIEGVIPGRSYQIGVSTSTPTGVRSVTMNTVEVSAVAKTDGTDYEIDAARGIITILEGGSISEGDDIDLDYDLAAVSREQIVSGNSQIEGALQYRAYNAEGDDIDYHMLYVKISPNGDLALKGDDWMTTPFNVEILKKTGTEAIYANGQPFVV